MQIAVASGKGGTGKTTISTSLALSAEQPVQYLDCDVEEPNGHIFLHPKLHHQEMVEVVIPEVNEENCSGCGKCRDICNFNAIVQFGTTVMTFPEMCHSCLGCFLVCDDDALLYGKRQVGVLESGMAGDVEFVHGTVRIGEAMGIPLLQAVKKKADPAKLTIIDAPPGTSCPFVETIADVDFVILVTEPTPFGLYDLKLAVEVVTNFNIPCGVIVNRANLGDDKVQAFCKAQHLPLLLEIPFQRNIAEGYARGHNIIKTVPQLKESMRALLDRLVAEHV